jgi:hypothetical protein
VKEESRSKEGEVRQTDRKKEEKKAKGEKDRGSQKEKDIHKKLKKREEV